MTYYRATIMFDVKADNNEQAISEAQSIVNLLGYNLINAHPDKIMRSSGFELVGVEDENWNEI
jgi:hypothetical protein